MNKENAPEGMVYNHNEGCYQKKPEAIEIDGDVIKIECDCGNIAGIPSDSLAMGLEDVGCGVCGKIGLFTAN